MSNGLIARYYLEMTLTKDCNISVQTLKEAVNSSLEMLEILIHEAKIQIKSSNIWVVLSCRDLKNRQSPIHMLESS